jgi:hypothetical protein
MSGEIWQFLVIGAVGIVVALLWLFIIYLPRRSAEDESDHPAKSIEDPEERD